MGTFDLTAAPLEAPRRLILHLSGDYGTGKTHLAFTSPEPIFYCNFDRGTEGVVEKFSKDKEIYIANPVIPSDGTQQEYYAIWQEFKAFWKELCQKTQGTIVLDTMTVLTELSKNAHFGKTLEIPPNKAYVWQEPMREMVRQTHDSVMNAIFIQRRGEVWGSVPDAKGRKPTDVRGFSAMPYEAQASIIMYRNDEATDDSQRFYGLIDKCRHNMRLMGKVIPDPSLGLLNLDFNELRTVVHS